MLNIVLDLYEESSPRIVGEAPIGSTEGKIHQTLEGKVEYTGLQRISPVKWAILRRKEIIGLVKLVEKSR